MAQKIILPIIGMHCKSCEILIEDNLKDVSGVKSSQADYRKQQVVVFTKDNSQPSMQEMENAIINAGYKVGESKKESGIFSKNARDYKELGIAFVLLVAMYFIFKGLGINFNISGANSLDTLTLPVIFLIGITAGFSTCMALVGGLVLGISAKHATLHPEATAAQKFRPHLFFNLGRFLSYVFFGGLLGIIGSVFQFSAFVLGLITIVVGLIMLLMGLQLIDILLFAKRLKMTLPKGISRMLGIGNENNKEYSHRNSALLGVLTFFLPCGFTQAMQVFAIGTGSFFGGALIMGTFALGTMPGLLGIGGLSSLVKGSFARYFFKLAGLVVIVFAVLNITNGLGLAGFGFDQVYNKNTSSNVVDKNVKTEQGVQIVRMQEVANGYTPNTFTVKKDVPVKWIITAQAPYSCAAGILMQKYNIRQNLQAGENIIEFTPTETGRVRFSCFMGMYTGYFNVVE